MVKRLTSVLIVICLMVTSMAVPVQSKSDFLTRVNKFDRTKQYSINRSGQQPTAWEDTRTIESVSAQSQPVVSNRSLGSASFGSASFGSAVASPGITVEKTWEDWQYTIVKHRVEWNTTPDIQFAYSDQATQGSNDRFGYNVYSPTLGSWPQGLEVGCEIQTTDGVGRWPSLDVNGKGFVVLMGSDDAGGGIENHAYFQTSQYSCFWGGGSVIDPGTYTSGFFAPATSTLINPEIEYQEWAGDTVVHVVARESVGGDMGTGIPELVIQYFRKDGTNAAGAWVGPVTIDSMISKTSGGGSLATSKISPKVAISYIHVSALGYANGLHGSGGPGDGGTCWTDNEVFYRQSDSLGVVWDIPINVTNYDRTVPSANPRHESYAFYDSQDGLHIIFGGRPLPANVYSEPLVSTFFFCDFSLSTFHWSDRTGEVSRVNNGDYGITWNSVHCGFGGNIGYTGRFSVGECAGNLYAIWGQVHDIFGIENGGVPQFDDCASSGGTRGRLDQANHEIWMSVSSSLDGLLWDQQRNITQSYTPGCDSAVALGGKGLCMNDDKASLSRFGMDEVAMTATFGALTWPAAALLDPSGSYAGDHYLQMFYLEDHWPGTFSTPGSESDIQVEGDLKWARLACIDPVTAPQIAVSPTSAGYPDQTNHGAQTDVVVTVTNDGNTALNISNIESIEDAGPAGWLSTSVTSLTVQAGTQNTATFDMRINTGGIVDNPGTIVFLPGRVRLHSDTPPPFDVVDLEVSYIVGPVADLSRDLVSSGTVTLAMSNHGNMGNGGLGGVNMDYTASGSADPDCDLTQSVYLFDGSPVVIQKIDSANGVFGMSTNLFAGGFAPSYAFKPQAQMAMSGSFTGPANSDAYNTGTFTNWDSTIALEQTFYAPTTGTPNDNFVLVRTRYFSMDGQEHANLMLGDLIDWDTPSDNSAFNLAGIIGRTVYLRGIDTATVAGCQLFANRFSASTFLGRYDNNEFIADPCANDSKLHGVYASANGSGNPEAQGALNGALDSALAWNSGGSLTGEWAIEDTALDQRINQTFVWDYTLGAIDTLTVYTALVTIKNGTVNDLDASVKAACDWYATNIRNNCSVCSCCKGITGNIDNDPMDICDIADLTFLIDNLFINFTAIACKEEGNIDGSADGVVDIADLTYLIDNLFINFTPNSDCR